MGSPLKPILFLLFLLSACAAPRMAPIALTPWELLNKSVQAYGGEEAVLNLQDMTSRIAVAVFRDGVWRTGESLLRFKQPDLLYSAIKIQGMGEKTVYNNGRKSEERINGKATNRSVKRDLKRRLRLSMIHAFFLENRAEEVQFMGIQEVNGRDCAVLLKKADQETWRIFIDQEQGLIRKIGLTLPPQDSGAIVDWTFDEFKRTQARMAPQVCVTRINDKVFQRGRLLEFQMNSGLTETDFTPFP